MAAASTDAYAGVGDGGVDGDDEVGMRWFGDDDVAAPSLKSAANDIVGKECAGVLDVNATSGHEAGVGRNGCGPGRLLGGERAEKERRRSEDENRVRRDAHCEGLHFCLPLVTSS